MHRNFSETSPARSKTVLASGLVGALLTSGLVLGVHQPAFATANDGNCDLTFIAGTSSYEIASAADLAEIPDCGLTADYVQTDDLGPVTNIVNVGGQATEFRGTYDGQGFEISLNITSNNSTGVGLFDWSDAPAQFSNMVLTGSVTSTSGSYVSSLTGQIGSGGSAGLSITDVHSSVTVTYAGANYSGGLIGLANNSTPVTILRSSFTGTVNSPGDYDVGGFAARMRGTITDSYVVSSNIQGISGYIVGGFLGSSQGVTFTNSYSASIVKRGSSVGGGGIAGLKNGSDTATGTFWNTTIGPARAYGFESLANRVPADLSGTEGKTTSDLQMASTFSTAGWIITETWEPYSAGLNLWGICPTLNGGYPYLLNQFSESEVLLAGCEVVSSDAPASGSSASAGVPGIFLYVAGPVGRTVGDSPVYYGADRVAAASEYEVRVLSTNTRNPMVASLASGELPINGSLPSTVVRLPQLEQGTYLVRMTGKHTTGKTLELTAQISVGPNGTFTAIGPNIPIIR